MPKVKPYEIRDARLMGFLIRVQPSGRKTYYCEYRRGARIKIGQFQTLSVKMAHDRAKEILAEYYRGGEPAIEMKRNKSASTYKQYLEERYFSLVDANHSSAQHTRRRLIVDCAQFLNKKLTHITPELVEKWRLAIVAKGNSPHTANRAYANLRASLTKAEEWGFLDEHPLRKMKPLKTDKNLKVRYLSKDEETRLRNALDNREMRMRTQRKKQVATVCLLRNTATRQTVYA